MVLNNSFLSHVCPLFQAGKNDNEHEVKKRSEVVEEISPAATAASNNESLPKKSEDATDAAKKVIEQAENDFLESFEQAKKESVAAQSKATEAFKGQVEKTEKAFNDSLAQVQRATEDVKNSTEKAFEDNFVQAQNAAEGVKTATEKAFNNSFEKVQKAAEDVQESTAKAIESTLEQAQSQVDKTVKAAEEVKAATEKVFNDSFEKVQKAAEGVQDLTSKAINDALEQAQSQVDQTAKTAKEIESGTEKAFNDSFEKVQKTAEDVKDSTAKAFDSTLEQAQNQVDQTAKAAKEVQAVTEKTFNDSFEKVQKTADDVQGTTTKAIDNALEEAENQVDQARKAADQGQSRAKDIVDGRVEEAKIEAELILEQHVNPIVEELRSKIGATRDESFEQEIPNEVIEEELKEDENICIAMEIPPEDSWQKMKIPEEKVKEVSEAVVKKVDSFLEVFDVKPPFKKVEEETFERLSAKVRTDDKGSGGGHSDDEVPLSADSSRETSPNDISTSTSFSTLERAGGDEEAADEEYTYLSPVSSKAREVAASARLVMSSARETLIDEDEVDDGESEEEASSDEEGNLSSSVKERLSMPASILEDREVENAFGEDASRLLPSDLLTSSSPPLTTEEKRGRSKEGADLSEGETQF